MRICFLARANYELLRQRAEHSAARGHDVHVISLEPGSVRGCEVHLPNRTGGHGILRYALAAPFVRRTVAALEPDVVDAHSVSSYGLFTLGGLGRPRVVTLYGPDVYEVAARSPLLRAAVRSVLRRADMVNASTRAVDGYVKEVVGIELGDRLRARSWGIPVRRITEGSGDRRTRIRRELGVGERTRVVIHCRHIAELWRPRVLVDALPAVVESHPDTELWFVYPQPNVEGRRLLDRLKRRAAELGQADRIRFLGPQPHERFISMLHAADVFTCIGKSDLLASTVLEALATGLVPVLSDLPAYREVIEDGCNGFLLAEVTPESVATRLADVLDRLDSLQPSLARHNREVISGSYDLVACNDWILEQYQELLEGGARRPSAGQLSDGG